MQSDVVGEVDELIDVVDDVLSRFSRWCWTRTCSCRARPAAKAGLATSARNVGATSLLR